MPSAPHTGAKNRHWPQHKSFFGSCNCSALPELKTPSRGINSKSPIASSGITPVESKEFLLEFGFEAGQSHQRYLPKKYKHTPIL